MQYSQLFAQMFPGMEWIPVMSLLLWGSILCGSVSIGASLCCPKSSFGFRTGILTIIIGVMSPPLFFCLTGNNLTKYAYLYLASPIVPGLLGVGLSRLPAGKVLWLARIAGILTAITGILTLGHYFCTTSISGQQIMELLGGSKKIGITCVSIEHQQRRVICTDIGVCDYFAESLRKARRGRGPELASGTSYSFTFHFNSGSEYCVEEACVFDKGFSLSIPEADPPEAGWMTHQVNFLDPIPDRLGQIWSFLDQRWEEVAGSVMVVEEGCHVRIEYDRQLDREGRNIQKGLNQ
jgi:hypothetical protein